MQLQINELSIINNAILWFRIAYLDKKMQFLKKDVFDVIRFHEVSATIITAVFTSSLFHFTFGGDFLPIP